MNEMIKQLTRVFLEYDLSRPEGTFPHSREAYLNEMARVATEVMNMNRIEVKKISVFLGMDQNGQMLGNTQVATENKRLFVIPCQHFIVEVMTPQGKVVKEVPIGPFGWEYTI